MTGRRTALGTLLLCQGVLIAGLTLSFPFMTLYLNRERGLGAGAAGLAISAALLATAAGQGVGGELADLWGSKRVMALSLSGRAALSALMSAAVAGDWPVSSIVALHVVGGFVGNLYDPAIRAWIACEHPISDRVRAFGLLRVAANAAWAVGPALGGLLAAHSYATLFAVTSAMCLLCLALLLLVVPPAPAPRRGGSFELAGVATAARDPRFLEFCGLTLLLACAMAQLVSPLSVHAARAGLDERRIGLLFGLNGGLVVLLQTSAARAVAASRLTRAAAVGCLFYAAAWSWMGFAASFPTFAVGMALATLGEVVISPSLHALAANLAPERVRGRYLGLQGLSYQLGQAAGPAFGGWCLERFSGRAHVSWLTFAAVAVAASAGFRRLSRLLTPEEQGVPKEAA